MNRPNREEYYMSIAHLASLRSTCLSRRVGAVVIKNDNLISFGYNGPARGVTHCENLGGCRRRQMPDYQSGSYLHLCPAVHAEQNAIAFAAYHGISTEGGTLYVSTFPCKDCMNSLINAGIKKIVYDDDYASDLSIKEASDAKIELVKYDGRRLFEILLDDLENLDKTNKIEIIKKLIKDLNKKDIDKIIK